MTWRSLFCLDGGRHCAGHTFLGRKEGHGIAVKLFNNDRKNEQVEQKNFFIFPIEISRTISTLIQATDNSEVISFFVFTLREQHS